LPKLISKLRSTAQLFKFFSASLRPGVSFIPAQAAKSRKDAKAKREDEK
jgi:hypothetical protein